MFRLSEEAARILQKRIVRVIQKARYHPASVKDHEKAAYDVIKPYLEPAKKPIDNQGDI